MVDVMAAAHRNHSLALRLLVRAGLSCLALLCVLLLAEAGLRLAGWRALRSRGSQQAATGAKTVLCLGDSWTFGVESGNPARWSYPAQLQALLDRSAGKGAYRVINGGKPGMDSRAARIELLHRLKTLDPVAVVVLVGGANYFRTVDYAALARDLAARRRGILDRSRLVRMLRMLIRPPGLAAPPRNTGASEEKLIRLIAGSPDGRYRPTDRERNQTEGAPPPVSTAGCLNPDRIAAQRQRLHHININFNVEEMELLGATDPRCPALLAMVASACLAHRELSCARRFARRALALLPDDPGARVVLARVLLEGESEADIRQARVVVQPVRDRYPKYLMARRLRLMSLVHSGSLCEVRDGIESLLGVHPSCRWARRALRFLDREVQGPAGRLLRQDLGAMLDLGRREGFELLLLNYPRLIHDPCGLSARRVIDQFARDRGITALDLGQQLGPRPEDFPSRLYASHGHPNARGYRRIAGAVQRALLQRLSR